MVGEKGSSMILKETNLRNSTTDEEIL